MAINFDTLKTSENYLRGMFLKFYNHVLESQNYLYSKFKSNKKLNQTNYNWIYKNEVKANQYEAQILDEASWIISKDMPRAAHLRYQIAIIRSIRDLERMGDFVDRVAHILKNQKSISNDCHKIICRIMRESYDFSKEIYRNLSLGSNQDRSYYLEKATPHFREFSAKYRAGFKSIGERIFNNKKNLNEKIAIFTAIKYLERNADHSFNIIENFVYIGDPNFYINKKVRKN